MKQFTVASTVYYTTSTLFPAKETYFEKAILTMEDSGAAYPEAQRPEDSSSVEKGSVKDEKTSVHV